MARIKVHELRQKNKADLLSQLKDLKTELALLRVAQASWKTNREKKKELYFPMRKYAIKV